MTARLRAGLAAATLAAAAMLACGDPNAPQANYATYADTLALYALNGAPRGAPTAIRLIDGALIGSPAVTVDPLFQIDLAVDIDDQGRPRLYPVRAVASPILNRHPVGIRRTTEQFDAITVAPTTGYVRDSVATLTVGEVVLIESADPGACGNFLTGTAIYAKMVVDSIRPATRQVFLRITADPNCGFESLVPGVPTD
jgi:hypothetical protein